VTSGASQAASPGADAVKAKQGRDENHGDIRRGLYHTGQRKTIPITYSVSVSDDKQTARRPLCV